VYGLNIVCNVTLSFKSLELVRFILNVFEKKFLMMTKVNKIIIIQKKKIL